MKLVYTFWLLLFGSILALVAPNSESPLAAPIFGYNERGQASIPYDKSLISGLGYDWASGLFASGAESQNAGKRVFFTAICKFLAAKSTVTLYHGTTTGAARNILSGGSRGGVDNAVFFGEEFSTARFFGEMRVAETGARSGQVLRYTMPQTVAQDLGLTSRQVLGEFRGAPPIDIPGGSGFERILGGGNIDLFNQAVRSGQITVKPIGIGP